MLCDYLFDMACLCEYVFICLCILCFGLEHVLIWCLIEFWSFRLLIHKVSSPNDVAMLFFVLIRWVDFIVVFRDDFSTIFQICVVVVVREGVTVHNPKTDSKSEFGCPSYGWRMWECAREVRVAERPRGPRRDGGRGPHGQRGSLAPCGPRAPHELGWHGHSWLAHFSLLSPPFYFPPFPPFLFKKWNWNFPVRIFSLVFSSSKHHNFFIGSQIWVIQVGEHL